MRRTERYRAKGGANSLWHIYRTVPFWKVAKNFVVIQLSRYTPFIPVKNFLFRTFLKMKIGEKTSFALMVMPDVMFPERITVGDNSIIGYNTTILAHEYLIDEYRIGDVVIGENVLIGANTTILPGVHIGDNAIVSAATLVNRDIPPGVFAGGNPVRIIYSKEEMEKRHEQFSLE
ncbi:DapH/DapD/GlmU-related protein [Sporosarcina pasteurii]|uniref:Galactoside O-acetyltransferase n=1 Tax=Sporosarcina pasteurii TaxID=1474 RepID=A0A380C9N3_SPOPA|nr:acyltransferase [Sporosarcina pasteurii]MDS9472683.1 acyltransferase [Sporosarcina pasteurii]QBQ04343.1 acyltransferase [Sporosarcina pasteurii]SUJ15829.1 Galactoside O-acetyltransferase [Sporosarcina pasteurii]